MDSPKQNNVAHPRILAALPGRGRDLGLINF